MSQAITKGSPLPQIYAIALKDIEISEDNVRHTDAMRDLDELAASIKAHYPRLRQQAERAGYRGLRSLCFTNAEWSSFTTGESMCVDFGNAVFSTVKQ